MATLTVAATTNFSSTALAGIDKIDFTNGITGATATFLASQFDNTAILDTVVIDASIGDNNIIVNGGSVDASLWTFVGWSALIDDITFNGGAAIDFFTGSSQSDTVNGNNGDDVVLGSAGADAFNGGANIDTIDYSASSAGIVVSLLGGAGAGGFAEGDTLTNVENVVGTSQDDIITGSDFDNTLVGGGDDDILTGNGGTDTFFGGLGRDTMDGGLGEDVFVYSGDTQLNESIDGGVGVNDRILLNGFTDFNATVIANVETVEFAGGNVRFSSVHVGAGGIQNVIGDGNGNTLQIVGAAVIDLSGLSFTNWGVGDLVDIIATPPVPVNWIGSTQADAMTFNGQASVYEGGGGDDLFKASTGGVVAGMTIDGGAGTDTLRTFGTGLFDFSIVNFSGVEVLDFFTAPASARLFNTDIGAGGVIEINGFNQNDTLEVVGGSVDMGLVNFSLWNPNAKITLAGGGGSDVIIGGGVGVEALIGGGGVDALRGKLGNDTLEGGADGDSLDGGSGTDTAIYVNATARVKVALDASFAGEGEALGDTFISVERVTGTGFGDVIRGNAVNNKFLGGNGNDTLQGMDGADNIVGGNGADALTGGLGDDTFDYTALTHLGDTIKDFSPAAAGNDDRLRFTGDVFGGLPAGALAASRFAANTSGAATTADHRFIYETDTGILRFDSNGNAAGGVSLVATFTGAPVLTAADFTIL